MAHRWRLPPQLFHLPHTFGSGHLFYWREETAGNRQVFVWPTRGVVLRLWRQGDWLCATGAPRDFVAQALGLEEDYAGMLAALGQHAKLAQAVARFGGLRLLRQDPWECVLGFVNATQSSVKRVQGHLRDLAARYGERVGGEALLPSPRQLPDEAALRRLGLGWRAKHLSALCERMGGDGDSASARLRALRHDDLEATLQNLMTLPGVGRKVASCVALYSLDHFTAVPVDVWIARGLRPLLRQPASASALALEQAARRRFGPHAGYAQQFLYQAARQGG